MMSYRTTARAQRRQAVLDGSAPDAVERGSSRSNPRGSDRETPTRSRQRDLRREIADELDIEADDVGAVDRIRGMDVFLRSGGVTQFGDVVRDDFASQADFVDPDDVDPRVDGRAIAAEPIVSDRGRSAVSRRARSATAADADFIEADDLRADVGRRGVSAIEVADDRRSAVADRARTSFAAEDPFAQPDDFDVQVGATGITQSGFTPDGERRRAGRQFESETALGSVDPFGDLEQTDDGFTLTGGAQRRAAARGFESQFDFFGAGDLDPERDIREIDGGFGLGRDPSREVAAREIDSQISEFDIGPGDIELRETDSGEFEGFFEREVSR